jgi:hypothetical protein
MDIDALMVRIRAHSEDAILISPEWLGDAPYCRCEECPLFVESGIWGRCKFTGKAAQDVCEPAVMVMAQIVMGVS